MLCNASLTPPILEPPPETPGDGAIAARVPATHVPQNTQGEAYPRDRELSLEPGEGQPRGSEVSIAPGMQERPPGAEAEVLGPEEVFAPPCLAEDPGVAGAELST